MMYNSINHLNEKSCISLLEDQRARQVYSKLFAKIASGMKSKGQLIVEDVSRDNFWPLIGRQNPFGKEIEWHKHQSPEMWLSLLGPVGFSKTSLSWYRFFPLRHFGVLLANRFVQYFILSHFRLLMNYK